MARTRNIKPAFFDNDTLGGLDPLIRLLFIGLWCIADREGRLEDRPRRIKKTLLGYDDVTAEETSGMLQQLADNGFIVRYTVEGSNYIQVTNFTKHQNPNLKEKASEIPPPPFIPHSEQREIEAEEEEPGEPETPEGGEEREEHAGERQLPQNEEHIDLMEIRFAAFWDAYPKKKSKQTAFRAWKKIKPDGALFDRIMGAVERQKESTDWREENGKYIPYPATWLNGGCWDDVVREDTVSPGTSFATDDFWNASLKRSYADAPTYQNRGDTE